MSHLEAAPISGHTSPAAGTIGRSYYLLGSGDPEFIEGHKSSQWLGHKEIHPLEGIWGRFRIVIAANFCFSRGWYFLYCLYGELRKV
jgi:hypothetical protein